MLQTPYSVWAGAGTALDGVGTWLATANDPAARPGQAAANYAYALGFGFTASDARGLVALTIGPAGKTATVAVGALGTTIKTATVPFAWSANRLYFLFVHQLAPGSWGA